MQERQKREKGEGTTEWETAEQEKENGPAGREPAAGQAAQRSGWQRSWTPCVCSFPERSLQLLPGWNIATAAGTARGRCGDVSRSETGATAAVTCRSENQCRSCGDVGSTVRQGRIENRIEETALEQKKTIMDYDTVSLDDAGNAVVIKIGRAHV